MFTPVEMKLMTPELKYSSAAFMKVHLTPFVQCKTAAVSSITRLIVCYVHFSGRINIYNA